MREFATNHGGSGQSGERESPLPVTCHIIVVDRIIEYEQGIVGVQCPTLPGEILDEVVGILASWKDPFKPTAELHALIAKYNLPGIALLVSKDPGDQTRAPSPLPIPFEPLGLNESNPSIRALMESDDPIEASGKEEGKHEFRWRDVAQILGTIMTCGYLLLMAWYFIWRKPGPIGMVPWWGWVMLTGLAIAAQAMYLWHERQWYVITGGLVARRARLGLLPTKLTRYVPSDTLLRVRPEEAGWKVSLWRPAGDTKLTLSDLECRFVLSAWQSPISPPPLKRLTDLR